MARIGRHSNSVRHSFWPLQKLRLTTAEAKAESVAGSGCFSIVLDQRSMHPVQAGGSKLNPSYFLFCRSERHAISRDAILPPSHGGCSTLRLDDKPTSVWLRGSHTPNLACVAALMYCCGSNNNNSSSSSGNGGQHYPFIQQHCHCRRRPLPSTFRSSRSSYCHWHVHSSIQFDSVLGE